MGIMEKVRNFLIDPRIKGVDIDTTDILEAHREILIQKRLMQGVFRDFYETCMSLSERYFPCKGTKIEMGAGVSLFKSCFPDVITTDVKPSPHLDRVLDVQKMDLPDSSVCSFFGINVFHHLPAPHLFFHELIRTLKPGGGCVLIEPYYGLFARFLYSHVHKEEYFDMTQESWEDDEDKMHFMSGANQALSYLVFIRDRHRFVREFPELEIVLADPITNYLRYLLSGGMNFRQLVPGFLTVPLRIVEFILSPFRRVMALHYLIVLRKRV